MEETIKLCKENDERVISLSSEDGEQPLTLEREVTVVGGAVYSVNGQTGDVVLTTSDLENTSGYVTGSELAEVAFTGEYDDLLNEPRDFTEEEWSLLWANQ